MSMGLLNQAIRQLGDAPVAAPITAEIMLLPSADSVIPFGTLSNLENTAAPGGHGLSEMSKDITVRAFNINGGDGGPYTVDYNITQTCTATRTCPNGQATEQIIAFAPPNQFVGIPAGTPNNDTSAQLAPNILYTGTGNVGANTQNYSPTVDSGGCTVNIAGTIVISDGSGNSVTLGIDGNEGNVTVKSDGSAGNYFDSYIWGNSLCIPL